MKYIKAFESQLYMSEEQKTQCMNVIRVIFYACTNFGYKISFERINDDSLPTWYLVDKNDVFEAYSDVKLSDDKIPLVKIIFDREFPDKFEDMMRHIADIDGFDMITIRGVVFIYLYGDLKEIVKEMKERLDVYSYTINYNL